jgi:hypothetical protein
VRDPQEPHRERADGRALARHRGAQLASIAHLVLLELALQELERERGAVHRHIVDLAQQVRERPDVVLVAMREHDRLDAVGVAAHVVEVGQHEIDAGHVPRREREPHVDDQDAAVELDARHVATDLPDPTEEDDPTDVRVRGDRRPPVRCGPGPAPRP